MRTILLVLSLIFISAQETFWLIFGAILLILACILPDRKTTK